MKYSTCFLLVAQRICLFCLSVCLCQMPVTGARDPGRELGSSAEPLSSSLSSLNQLSFSCHAPRTLSTYDVRGEIWCPLGSNQWQRSWRERKQENQAERQWKVQSQYVETSAQQVGGTGNISGFECRNSGDASAEWGGPVVMLLSPLSSFKTFSLGHPRQFTYCPSPLHLVEVSVLDKSNLCSSALRWFVFNVSSHPTWNTVQIKWIGNSLRGKRVAEINSTWSVFMDSKNAKVGKEARHDTVQASMLSVKPVSVWEG